MTTGVLCVIFAYFLGSIPFGLLIAKTFCNIDPRTSGSKNVGSTNVARLCGKKWGTATLICDILKGLIPVYICMQIVDDPLYYNLTAIAAILGHLFSCFLKFKGGKAVATSIGVLIPLAFYPLLISVIACVLIIWRTKYVSLGSLFMVTLLPIILIYQKDYSVLPVVLVITAFVYYRHVDNIKRLLKGEEKAWQKSKNEDE